MPAVAFWSLFGCMLGLPAATARPVDDGLWWLALILASANSGCQLSKAACPRRMRALTLQINHGIVCYLFVCFEEVPWGLALAAGLQLLRLLCCADVESCSSLHHLALLLCPHLLHMLQVLRAQCAFCLVGGHVLEGSQSQNQEVQICLLWQATICTGLIIPFMCDVDLPELEY